MKKICLLLVLCLFLSACSAFAEETDETTALIEQARDALEVEDFETAVSLQLQHIVHIDSLKKQTM